MTDVTLPTIIRTRLAEAVAEPSIPRWRSFIDLVEATLSTCRRAEPTAALVGLLEQTAADARKRAAALTPCAVPCAAVEAGAPCRPAECAALPA